MGIKHVLVTIPASNYCEKAIWGLRLAKIDFKEEMHAPLFHYMSTMPKGGKSVPMLFNASTTPPLLLTNSDDILTYCGKSLPSLYPHAGVKEKEMYFDDKFGPAARRFGYMLLFSIGSEGKNILVDPLHGRLQAHLVSASFPLMKSALIKALNITDKGVERSWVKIQQVFDEVNSILGDKPLGSTYIAGDTFTAADISFCAHASLLLGPPQNPFLAPYFKLDEAPKIFQDRCNELSASKAGQFVSWCYANHYPANNVASKL